MAMINRRRLLVLTAASALPPALFPRASRADDWPSRTVHMVVPISAGGPNDTCARIVAERLAKTWGQQVVVDNKPGAGTNIGNEFVAHSDPDGYTMLFGTVSLGVNAILYRSISYDPIADFAPVSLVAKLPFFMFVPNSSPAKTVMELVAQAKANPGKLIMGSPGTGSAPHLAEVLFMQMAKIEMTHVPYGGAAPAFVDLIPGRIDCYFGSGELLQYWRSGQVRALATTGDERAAVAPELPTIAEAGIAGYEVDSWQGVFVPAKTAPAIVKKMSGDIIAALADPPVKNKLQVMGYAAEGSSPQQLAGLLKSEMQKWTAIIKTAGIKID
jgi:tripartite-type tricarboxylate transporter receptor subunit TctC